MGRDLSRIFCNCCPKHFSHFVEVFFYFVKEYDGDEMRKIMIFLVVIIMGVTALSVYEYFLPKSHYTMNERIVLDSTGKKISIPASPKRIIAASPASLEMIISLGGKDRLVGYAEYTSMTEELKEQVKDLPSIGSPTALSLEKAISLKADLVVGSNHSGYIQETFNHSGLPMIIMLSQSYQDNIDQLRLVGELVGKQEEAELITQEMNAKIEEEQKRHKNKRAPSALVILGSSSNFWVLTSDSLNGDFLRLAGGNNLADEVVANSTSFFQKRSGYVSISLEYILQSHPEYIFFIDYGQSVNLKEALLEDVKDNSSWDGIIQSSKTKVVVIPKELFGINPTIHSPEAVIYLSRILYPEDEEASDG